MEHAIMCPQCSAPLAPHKFARSVVCSYCGTTVQLDETSVSAAIFHEAFRVWNSPANYGISAWVSIGSRHWAVEKLVAHGDISEVFTGRLARWPTELVILKFLRDHQDADLFDHEWDVLRKLQRSDARGADTFTTLLPRPIFHGNSTGGSFVGQRVSIFGWESGFYHTFEDVMRAYPQGINPRASVWVWRRILEILSFIHASGMVHGAILPRHLLVQENDHGVRMVGYSFAGRIGEKLRVGAHKNETFYPQPARSWSTLTEQLDLVLSARCIVAILGGDPASASLPASVPAQLAAIVRRIALSNPGSAVSQNAWTIREELGEIAGEVFGPPKFVPIVMPS
jgi:hypothetical protein